MGTEDIARNATPTSTVRGPGRAVQNADGTITVFGESMEPITTPSDGGGDIPLPSTFPSTRITGIQNRYDITTVSGAQVELVPPLAALTDNSDRALDLLTGYNGRGKISVWGAQDKTNASPVKFQTINFFITSIETRTDEAFSIQKNNIGYVMNAFDTNPTMIKVSGIFLDGNDIGAERRGERRGALANKILNTEWFSDFVRNYHESFKASVSIKNGTRIYFAAGGFSAEVFVVGFSTSKSSAPYPDLIPFNIDMVVKALPIKNSGGSALDGKTSSAPAGQADSNGNVVASGTLSPDSTFLPSTPATTYIDMTSSSQNQSDSALNFCVATGAK